MKRTYIFSLATAMLIVFCCGNASAVILDTWDNEAAFIAATSPSFMESFESATFTSSPSTFTVADFVVTSNNTSHASWDGINSTLTPQSVTDGVQNIKLGLDDGESVFFDFDFNVKIVGFNLWGAADVGGDPVITFYDSLGNAEIIVAGNLPGDNLQFFGAQSDVGLSGFSVLMTGADGDGLFFDEVYYDSVPEPCSLILLGLGGMMICKRKKS